MPFSKWRKHRYVRPIRTLSIALGLLGLMIGTVLYFFLTEPGPTPPLFKYAFITLPFEAWCVLFFISGLTTLLANLRQGTGIRFAHAFGATVWAYWATILTFGFTETGLATSGYSFLCLIAALAHWVCASYWEAENPRVRG